MDDITPTQRKIAAYLFASAVLTSVVSTFIGSNIRRRSLTLSANDALLGGGCFFIGGFVPFVIGISIRNRIERDICLFVLTTGMIALLLVIDFSRKKDDQQQPRARTYWILGVCIVLAISVIVFLADQANQLRSASNKQNKTQSPGDWTA